MPFIMLPCGSIVEGTGLMLQVLPNSTHCIDGVENFSVLVNNKIFVEIPTAQRPILQAVLRMLSKGESFEWFVNASGVHGVRIDA